MKKPLVSILMLNWNGRQHLTNALNSVKEHTKDFDYELILVDQGSTDGSVELVEKQFPWVQIIKNKANLGIPIASNKAIRKASGKYLYFLGNDTIVSKNWLKPCIDLVESEPMMAIVGSTLVAPKKVNEIHPKKKWKYRDNVCSQGMLATKKVFDLVGLYDENHFNPYGGEETDWEYRALNAGFKIAETEESIVGHIGGGDTKRQNPDRELLLNIGRLRAMLFNDSFFSFLKRIPGLGLVFVRSFQNGTTLIILKSYWIVLSGWKIILKERKIRSDALKKLRKDNLNLALL